MFTLKEACRSIVEVKRSKFISHLVPFGTFDECREKLRAEHPKASHIVTASRYIDESGRVSESSSDDGEPRGCAGVPALNVLRGNDLVDCSLLIVRYFGGIKLGTGGMVRAYSEAAKAAVAECEKIPYEKEESMNFFTAYGASQRIEYLLREEGIDKVKRDYPGEGVKWEICASAESLRRFAQKAGRLIEKR